MRKFLPGLLLALAMFMAVPVSAKIKPETEPVQWLNSFRNSGATAVGNGVFGSNTKLDTLYANLNGATYVDESIAAACTSMVISTDGWVLPPAYMPITSTAQLDSAYIIGRLIVYTDSLIAQNLTAATFSVDVMPGPDYRDLAVTAPTGVQIATTAYTSMGSNPVYSFPIFLTRGLGQPIAAYVANPSGHGLGIGHRAIRIRISSMTGILRRAKMQVTFYKDE